MVRENEARAFGCLLDDMLMNYDGTRGGSDSVVISETAAGQTDYTGDKIVFDILDRNSRIRGQRTAIHGTLLSKGKTEEELQELERKRKEMFKQASKLRREAAKEIVHIKIPEDGYKKTISSLRQLADELMHPTRSVRPKNFDLVVERVRESEKILLRRRVRETDRKNQNEPTKKVRRRSNVRIGKIQRGPKEEKWRSTENKFDAEVRTRSANTTQHDETKRCS